MSKMKLCPCCQGEGAVRYKEIFAGVIPRPQWPVIQCDECGLATKPYPTEAEAIAAWNKRAGEADYRRLRELEQAVRAMREFAPDTLVWQHNYDAIGRLLEGEE